jgi:hypothetical protein
MRELWILTHDYWSLPISVEWPYQHDVAMVRIGSGIRLLDSQRAVAQELLEKVGKRHENRWMLMRHVLEQVAIRADTENPEECVSWRPVKSYVQFKKRGKAAVFERMKQREAFFSDFCKSGILTDPAHAEILWTAFCKHALHTLVNRQEPVDMLFCELTPLPYRPNWMSLVSRAEKVTPDSARATAEDLVERGTLDYLLDPALTFYNRKAETIHWSITVRHLEMWYRMVTAAEKARKRGRTPHTYLRLINDAMKRTLPMAVKCYAAYLAEVFRPSLFTKVVRGVHGSVRTRTKEFIERERRATGMGERGRGLNSVGMDRRKDGRWVKRAPVENVPGVPDLQPPAGNVRDLRPEVGQPGDAA